MCCVMTTVDEVSYGWIADDLKNLTPHLFADANFAGYPHILKSTNGCRFDILGPNSRFPIAACCLAQASIAQISTESEASSMNVALEN